MNEHQPQTQPSPEEPDWRDAFAAYTRLHDEGDRDAATDSGLLSQFKDAYFGQYPSPGDWARELLGEGLQAKLDTVVPDTLRAYVRIDYAGLAQDAAQHGEIHIEPAPDDRVWIFLKS
jgi:hypothetical protein